MPDYKTGDLLWVHIGGGYGWWPCQVMEPHHTPEQRRAEVLRIKRPGCVLVHCHGDDTFNWFDPRDIRPLTDNYDARAAQKHKSAAVKRYFKLALEQVQEITDNREGRPPVTSHKAVDFTRPETYEHLIAPMPAADEDNSNAADVMRYPAAVTAEDCRAAAAVVVQWLVETAAEPGERCKELVAAAAAAVPYTSAATDQAEAADASANADKINADVSEANADLTPVCMRLLWSYLHEAAVDEHGPNRFVMKKKSVKRKSATVAATPDAAAAVSAGKGKKQQQQEGAEAASEGTQKLNKRKSDVTAAAEGSQQQPKKRRKQQQQSPPTAAVDSSAQFYNVAPSPDDEYVFRYGGPIPGANLRKAVQFLFQAALNPEPIVSHLTHSHAKAIAVLVRWREAEFEESRCKEMGCVSKVVKGMLIRADAYPIAPPPQSPAAAAASSSSRQQDEGDLSGEDAGCLGVDRFDWDGADSDSDRDDDDHVSRRARKVGRSSRGIAEDERSALAAIKAARTATKQERNFLRQQQLAALKHEGDESDSSGEVGRDEDSSSDWGTPAGSSKQHRKQQEVSSAAAAAAAGGGGGSDSRQEKTTVEVKQYSGRILPTPNAWSSDVQRWSAERGKEATFSKVCGHTVATSDAHTIFSLVADRGGFEAASQRHAWHAIAREWHPSLAASARNISSQLKKWYSNHLLDYELHISAGCPVVRKAFSLKGAKRAPAGEPRPAARKAVKVKQEPVEDDYSDDDEQQRKAAVRKVKREPGLDSVKLEPGTAAAATEGPRRRLALPQQAAAAASPSSSKPGAAAADNFIAAAAGGDKHNSADRRLVKFTFRDGYRLPPLLTVLKAAQKYQHDIDAAMIRVYQHQPVASILFSSATIADYAANGFRKYGRRMLRVPDDELFEVELTWLPSRKVDSCRDPAAQASNSSRSAAAAAAADHSTAAAIPAAAAANYPAEDKCLMRIHFRHGYKMPAIQTLHQTAKRFQRDLLRDGVRVYKHDYVASVFYKDASTAAAAAEWFRQNGRQALKVPEDEKFEIEVTWLISRDGEVVKPRSTSAPPYTARASKYNNSSAADPYQQQQQQQLGYPGPHQSTGFRPMLSLAAAAGLGQQQQQQPTFALPGGIVIVPGPAPIGIPIGAPGLTTAAALPGLGAAAVSQSHMMQQPLLLDPRRQQQQHVPPPQPPPLPPQQQQPVLMMSAPQSLQQPQQPPAQQTVVPIIDLAALANAIGMQQQQQQLPPQLPPSQQQHMQQLQMALQQQQPPQQPQLPQLPLQLQQPQPQLPIHQLQLPQMQPMPPPSQQQLQQQQVSQPPWHQAEFQAKLQDLLRDLGHSTRTG